MNNLKRLFWWIWGLPQNIIGFTMMVYLHNKGATIYRYKDAWVIEYKKTKIGGAVSLGQYIFIWSRFSNKQQLIQHEYGHTRQSHLLGPIYLLVIGVPSFVWNMFFQQYRIRNGVSYYDFWVEAWADKLGKVNRN